MGSTDMVGRMIENKRTQSNGCISTSTVQYSRSIHKCPNFSDHYGYHTNTRRTITAHNAIPGLGDGVGSTESVSRPLGPRPHMIVTRGAALLHAAPPPSKHLRRLALT